MRPRLRLYAVLFVVPRMSSDERTVAIVQAKVADQELVVISHFFKALVSAVTEWVRDTRIGQRAWVESHEDLNIGDLHHYEDTASLRQKLVAHHIHDLNIQTFVNIPKGNWTFDDILVDTAALS
jgi:hypothetical protein